MNPVLVALDYSDLDRALSVARETSDHVGGYKVGLELLMAEGPRAVATIAEIGLPVFADAKLHDIPNTVAGAARQLASHGARWVTVHAAGGSDMMSAAVDGLAQGAEGREVGMLTVTVLTSLDEADLESIGLAGPISRRTVALAKLGRGAGTEGVVVSPHEVAAVRDAAPNLLIVTPGIRPDGAGSQDQKRFATPDMALAAGADLLVIGRAITEAGEPREAARAVAEMIRSSP